MNTQKSQAGFTLIELMIVVAIIGILASIAVPAYQTYTKKAKFTEVVNATAPFKTAIELCATNQDILTNCNGATPGSGVPANLGNLGTHVASVTTAGDGVITATGQATVSGLIYILTPTYVSGTGVNWVKSGSCLTDANPVC